MGYVSSSRIIVITVYYIGDYNDWICNRQDDCITD